MKLLQLQFIFLFLYMYVRVYSQMKPRWYACIYIGAFVFGLQTIVNIYIWTYLLVIHVQYVIWAVKFQCSYFRVLYYTFFRKFYQHIVTKMHLQWEVMEYTQLYFQRKRKAALELPNMLKKIKQKMWSWDPWKFFF